MGPEKFSACEAVDAFVAVMIAQVGELVLADSIIQHALRQSAGRMRVLCCR